jgi:taurine dioxygenase
MQYDKIKVAPISGALGADVGGADLSRPLDESTLAEIKRAFAEYLVLFFHDQHLDPEQQVGFARQFGPVTRHPSVVTLAGHTDVLRIVREADEAGTLNFGGVWHTDAPFLERPPLGSTLYAVEAPPYGGDTLFANLYLAYEALSDGLRKIADQLFLVHGLPLQHRGGSSESGASSGELNPKSMQFDIKDVDREEMAHPLVRIVPQTNRKALFVSGDYGIRFRGWTADESKPLLRFFQQHLSRPEFTCRFRWRKGVLAMWDNRCTQHLAINDYDGFRRVMHRVQIEGERPIGPVA